MFTLRRYRVLGLLFVAGCVKTTLTSMVSPNAPRYGHGQVLVVADYADLEWRRDVELGIQERHPAFVASVEFLDLNQLDDPTAIAERVRADSNVVAILMLSPSGAGVSNEVISTGTTITPVTKPWANTTARVFDQDFGEVWRGDASSSGNAFASWSDVRDSFLSKIVDQVLADRLLVDGAGEPRSGTSPRIQGIAEPTEWARPLPAPEDFIYLEPNDFNPADVSIPPVERAANAVVQLEGNQGLGTAFTITRSGLAITNHHVVAAQDGLVANFGDGRVAPVRVIRSDREADVALIQVHCETACRTLPLGSADDIRIGSDIYALGNPSGLTGTVTRGIVSGLRRAESITLVQVDAALNLGNSGGPIIDAASGAVVAVVSFKLRQREGLGFGIAIDDALRVLGVRQRPN